MLKRELESLLALHKKAYAPYSNFKVACSLYTNGRAYYGVNVENASYGLTQCAERGAISSAISSEGKMIIDRLYVLSSGGEALPCGACRQVIAEFSDENTKIYILGKDGTFKKFSLQELLPYSFKLEQN